MFQPMALLRDGEEMVDIYSFDCMLSYFRNFSLLHPSAPMVVGQRRKSILKVKLPLQRDLHVHGATGAPYWPTVSV